MLETKLKRIAVDETIFYMNSGLLEISISHKNGWLLCRSSKGNDDQIVEFDMESGCKKTPQTK